MPSASIYRYVINVSIFDYSLSKVCATTRKAKKRRRREEQEEDTTNSFKPHRAQFNSFVEISTEFSTEFLVLHYYKNSVEISTKLLN